MRFFCLAGTTSAAAVLLSLFFLCVVVCSIYCIVDIAAALFPCHLTPSLIPFLFLFLSHSLTLDAIQCSVFITFFIVAIFVVIVVVFFLIC